MPIEVQTDGDGGDELETAEPGQQAYESLLAIVEVSTELEVMGLLTALKRGDRWAKVPPAQRELCAALEDELFEDGG